MTSETTVGTKKTSYSEKVALFAKESIFTKDGNENSEDVDLIKTNDNNTANNSNNEPTSTAMVSVDDEPNPGDDDVLQGEVVSSQIITSR